MNNVTIAIPRRWGNATARILRLFEDRDRLRLASIEKFGLQQIPPLDEGQIWAFESSLDATQAIFVDASIAAMNTALSAKTSDGWRATQEVTIQAKRDVEDIESIRAAAAGNP